MSDIQTATINDSLDALIASLNLKYKAEFVPQSESRNSNEKNPSLNWKVTVGNLTTDYMQGIGHAPDYEQGFTQDGWKTKYYKKVAETGKYRSSKRKMGNGRTDWFDAVESSFGNWKPLPMPALKDVLYSLVMDASVLDYSGFESSASEYGYDTDSKKAEGIYKDCLSIALKLRNLIGEDKLRELQTAFQDY